MKTVREMFVSLTAMLINHIWASIIEICVEKWRTQSLKKIEIQMSRHEKRYRSEEMSPWVHRNWPTVIRGVRIRKWNCLLKICLDTTALLKMIVWGLTPAKGLTPSKGLTQAEQRLRSKNKTLLAMSPDTAARWKLETSRPDALLLICYAWVSK